MAGQLQLLTIASRCRSELSIRSKVSKEQAQILNKEDPDRKMGFGCVNRKTGRPWSLDTEDDR